MAQLPEYLTDAPLGTEPVAREVMEAHQRERVIALVTPVFAKRGYQGTTVDDLLAAGKVGVTNFYGLFEGKEECFLACLKQVLASVRSEIAAVTAPASGWAESTYWGLHRLIESILSRPLEARLVLIEAQSAGPEALLRYNALLDEAVAWLRRGRKASAVAPSLPPGFEQAAASGLAFYLQQCLLDSRRHQVADLFDEAAGLVLEPIVGAEALRGLRTSPPPAS